MKSVCLISEENHGLIGVAADYQSAIRFLIAENWLEDNLYTNAGITIKQLLGDNWKDNILETNEDWFLEMFDGCLYLNTMPLYE